MKTGFQKQEDSLPQKQEQNDYPQISPEVSEAIKNLEPKQQEIIIQSIQSMRQESFSGPIPHPDLLQGYDRVKPGFAERIVVMAEQQQQHRFDCERQMIKGTIVESKRGQWMAFAIALLFLVAAVVLGIFNHDWLAGVIGGGTLIALVTVFVTGRKIKKDED